MYSLDETNRLIEKAAIGSGLSMGLAIDLAQASVWCCQHNLAGAQMAVESLMSLPKNYPISQSSPFNVAINGMNCFEHLLSHPAKPIDMTAAKSPLLMLGYAALACRYYASALTVLKLQFDESPPITVNQSAFQTELPNTHRTIKNTHTLTISVSPHHRLATDANCSGITRLDICPSTWHKLSTLAAKTYVAANTFSKEFGAGAGTTDND